MDTDTGMKKRIVVLGKGDLSGKVAQWFLEHSEYELVAVVPNQPPSFWTLRLEEWAKERGVPVVASGLTKDVPEGPIDLAVSVTYDKIIKTDFIARCGRIINIHNGPLPKYRGVNPVNWALKNGEKEHGVTMHEITPGIDDGPVIAQRMFAIDPEKDEVVDVYKRCLEEGWELFLETMPNFWDIMPVPQNESAATHYTGKDFDKLDERSYFTREESRSKLGLSR